MTVLTIEWEPPAAATRPVGDRTAPRVFGVVIDADSVRTRRFVRRARRPGDHTIQAPIEPIGGLAIAGVIALRSDGSGPGGAGEASDHEVDAGAAIDRLVGDLVGRWLPAARIRDVQLRVEQGLADRRLTGAHRLVTLDGRIEVPFDLWLDGPVGPHVVRGVLGHEASVVAEPVAVGCGR